jgi:hypothetical protein
VLSEASKRPPIFSFLEVAGTGSPVPRFNPSRAAQRVDRKSLIETDDTIGYEE